MGTAGSKSGIRSTFITPLNFVEIFLLFPESLLAFLKVLHELSHKVITCLLKCTVTHSVLLETRLVV